jgi:hypothetical protein
MRLAWDVLPQLPIRLTVWHSRRGTLRGTFTGYSLQCSLGICKRRTRWKLRKDYLFLLLTWTQFSLGTLWGTGWHFWWGTSLQFCRGTCRGTLWQVCRGTSSQRSLGTCNKE